jgi:hypothetical protein
MKKLITLAAAAVAFAGAVVAAGPIEDPKTCTEAEFRAAVAEALAPSNLTRAAFWQRVTEYKLFPTWLRFPEARAELDALMAERNFAPHDWWRFVDSWPKCAAAVAVPSGAAALYPKTLAIANRLGRDVNPSEFGAYGTLTDMADWLSEAVAFPVARHEHINLSAFREWTQKAALKAVKRHLRSQGKSFVTKNGVNPCGEYMVGLTEALNAPRFAGLDAWLKSIGLKGVDLSKMPSEEEVAKLKEAILFGDRDMDNRAKAILNACLGVDGYNEFVKEYNGDK